MRLFILHTLISVLFLFLLGVDCYLWLWHSLDFSINWAATWQNQQRDCLVWSESSLSAWRKLGSLATHWTQAKTDQTGRMPRLIWVFAGGTVTSLLLSCRGPTVFLIEGLDYSVRLCILSLPWAFLLYYKLGEKSLIWVCSIISGMPRWFLNMLRMRP